MGIFDIFRRQKKVIQEKNIISFQENQIVESVDTNFNSSTIISNEIIMEIKRKNNIEYINNNMIKKMEKYPKLVDLLLEGNVSRDVLTLLGNGDGIFYLPQQEEDLKFIEFLDLNEEYKKIVSLLKNRVNDNVIDNTYFCCNMDLMHDFETICFNNQVSSFIPNIKINMPSEELTKISLYSPFTLYFPKTKHKIVFHHYNKFISGNIDLDEDTIIKMSYNTFRYLDENVINKISRCKIIFSDDEVLEEKNVCYEEEVDYNLLKYNHLIYVIEKSSLDFSIKNKLLYKIKNMYIENKRCFDFEIFDKIVPQLGSLGLEEIKRITFEFEENIQSYMSQKIEKPEFNITLHIDSFFPDLTNVSINDIIHFLNMQPEELRISILREPRISKKLSIPDGMDDNELKNIIFLLSQRLSSTTIDFVKSFDFDVEKFMYNPNNDYLTSFDINYIIDKYGVFDGVNETKNISIADIVGYNSFDSNNEYSRKNILHTFENFFKKGGDGYHTRSLSLLEYKSGEQLLSELEKRNDDTKDMKIRYIDDGKYIVSGNGLHRFTVLRFHYLLDCMKQEKSAEELRELYKIPVQFVSKTNYKHTYCNYIIQKANSDISYISFYNPEKITIEYKSTEQKLIVDENGLIELMRQSVCLLNSYDFSKILQCYNKYNSFREFVDQYIPDILNNVEIEDKGGIQR